MADSNNTEIPGSRSADTITQPFPVEADNPAQTALNCKNLLSLILDASDEPADSTRCAIWDVADLIGKGLDALAVYPVPDPDENLRRIGKWAGWIANKAETIVGPECELIATWAGSIRRAALESVPADSAREDIDSMRQSAVGTDCEEIVGRLADEMESELDAPSLRHAIDRAAMSGFTVKKTLGDSEFPYRITSDGLTLQGLREMLDVIEQRTKQSFDNKHYALLVGIIWAARALFREVNEPGEGCGINRPAVEASCTLDALVNQLEQALGSAS